MKNRDAKYNSERNSIVNTWCRNGVSRLCAGAAVVALVFFTQPVAAQDAANPFTGLYIGGHAGYSWSDATFSSAPYTAILSEDVPVSGRSDKFDLDGGLVGGHLGYSVVTRNNVLFGIEGDLTHLGNKDSVSSSLAIEENGEDFVLSHRSELELDWQATIRARLGIVSGNKLFYGTVGIAFLNVDWTETATAFDDLLNQTFVQNHSASKTLTGFVVGGGVDVAVSERAILGAEYFYENFGSFGSAPFGHNNPAQLGRIGDLDVHMLRARLSIKLGRTHEVLEPLK